MFARSTEKNSNCKNGFKWEWKDAKKLVADAEKAGQQAVAESKNLAEAQAKNLLAKAEQDAAGDAARIKKQADADCAALRSKAEGRLEEAASLIVRKVVDA